jgi:hypothetical protein
MLIRRFGGDCAWRSDYTCRVRGPMQFARLITRRLLILQISNREQIKTKIAIKILEMKALLKRWVSSSGLDLGVGLKSGTWNCMKLQLLANVMLWSVTDETDDQKLDRHLVFSDTTSHLQRQHWSSITHPRAPRTCCSAVQKLDLL